ncbi:TetR/AcrR family transcriptional regulator [Paenibacillus bovis]|uniref:TetR family transcriptional regulator n=1 Tax=Paenibacillus bovis TaxID=1616788 RepID=A0A172ZIH0_9BACL|nr:TetR/AcrR family transcriptional regulator [Paenibacillus bovis]ANF97333.1 TetR family transcriptional regulator [Paenibacillus bovis]
MDRRIRKTKQAFHQALLQLLEQQDFRAITITDIVNAADVNRGTFYKHYMYKEDLLDELIEGVLQDLTDSYMEPYGGNNYLDVSELVSSAITIFDHVAAHRSFYRLIIHSHSMSGFQQRICSQLQRLCLQGMNQVSSSPYADNKQPSSIHPELFASYQAYAIWGLIMNWAQHEFEASPDYMAEQLLLIVNYSAGR